MSNSGRSQEEKFISLPIINNDELGNLIDLIKSKMNLVDKDNDHNIILLLDRLNEMKETPASSERSLKIHSEVMKTYLVDGYTLQRKKITKGDPSIRTCLAAAIDEFNKSKNSLFTGYIDVKKEKPEDMIEMGIIHSIRHPQEVKEIVQGCYQEMRNALTQWGVNAHDNDLSKEAQRIYQNAKRVVIELEDKSQESSKEWNNLLKKDGFEETALAIPLDTPAIDNRDKKSVIQFFSQNKEDIRDRVQQTFFPYLLIHLLNEECKKVAPINATDPESVEIRKKVKTLTNQIDTILQKNPEPGTQLEKIKEDIFKLCSMLYHDTFIHDTSKSGHTVIKSAFQKILENAYYALYTSGKVDLLVGPGDKVYDKILNSVSKKSSDSVPLSTQKLSVMKEQVQEAFTIAMTEGLMGKSAKAQDIFIYAYKAVMKQGYFAIAEFNRNVANLQLPAASADNAVMQNPKEKKEYNKMVANNAKNFVNVLGLKENEKYKEENLGKLYEFIKATPQFMEKIRNQFAAIYEAKEEKPLPKREEIVKQPLKANTPTPSDTKSDRIENVPPSISLETEDTEIPPPPPEEPSPVSSSSGKRYGLFASDSTATTANPSVATSAQPTRSSTPVSESVIPTAPPLPPPTAPGVLNIPDTLKSTAKKVELKVDTNTQGPATAAPKATGQPKFNIEAQGGKTLAEIIASAMAQRNVHITGKKPSQQSTGEEEWDENSPQNKGPSSPSNK